MLFPKGVLFLLLSQSAESFTVVAPLSSSSSSSSSSNSVVAFAPPQLSSVRRSCLNTALFSEPEAPPSVEETSAVEEEEGIVTAVVEEEETVEEEEEPVAAVVEEELVVAATEDTPATEDSAESSSEESGFDIYIGNMSFDSGPEKVEEMFAPFGSIKSLTVPLNKMTGQPRGFAFVTMADEASGLAAMESLNGKEADGRTLKVVKQLPKEELDKVKRERPVEPRISGTKIYVGNLPFDTESEELTALFAPYGEINDVFIPLDRMDGRPRGFAFVTMPPEAAQAAIEALDRTEFGGRNIAVNVSRPKGEGPVGRQRERRNPTQKLYVGNLAFATEEQQIYDVFNEYGDIQDVYFPLDRDTGRPRGFCFVTMGMDEAAQAMNEVDGMELDGRILRVNEAVNNGGPPRRTYRDTNEDDSFGSFDSGYDSYDSYGNDATEDSWDDSY